MSDYSPLIQKTDHSLKTKQREMFGNVGIYSKALYTYTLADLHCELFPQCKHIKSFQRRDHSFSGIFWCSHSCNMLKARHWRRPQKHVNIVWTQRQQHSWSYFTPWSQRGTIFWESFRGDAVAYWTRPALYKWFIVSWLFKLLS